MVSIENAVELVNCVAPIWTTARCACFVVIVALAHAICIFIYNFRASANVFQVFETIKNKNCKVNTASGC